MDDWLAASNILAVRLDNIGDVIMLGPALRAVKETAPAARLTLLASPAGATAAPLLPWIDDVIVWRAVWQDVGGRMPFDPGRERELIALLAERAFDAALIFTSFSQTPHVPGYVCYLAGIPLRAGESREFGGATLTTELRGAPDELHQVERNLRLVERLGFVVRDRRLVVAIGDAARAAIAHAGRSAKPPLLARLGLDPAAPFIVLHPGASTQARRYPPERFGAVARQLAEHGWPVLVTGTEREAALIETVIQLAPSAHALAGGMTLMEYAALIERAALVICNNSLPLHLADAVMTPALALYAGTDYEEQWRPRTTRAQLLRRPTPCHPCYLFTCPIGQPCLDIPPEEVVATAAALLASGSQPSGGDAITALLAKTPCLDETAAAGAKHVLPQRMQRDAEDVCPPLRPAAAYTSLITPLPSREGGPGGLGLRIAIFRALYLGDLLLAVPALRAIRARFPDAEITLIGLPWATSFAHRFPRYLDRFVAFPGYPGIAEGDAADLPPTGAADGELPERVTRFLAEQRAYHYDLVIQMHGSGEASNPFALALGGRMTVGYYRAAGRTPPLHSLEDTGSELQWVQKSPVGTTRWPEDEFWECRLLPYPEDQPEIYRNLGLAVMLDCADLVPTLEFPLSAEDRAEAAALLNRPLAPKGRDHSLPTHPCCGLHPGARAPAKRWPAEHFAALGDALAERFGARIVLTGGPSEVAVADAVAARMKAEPLNVAGQTSLGGLGALIAQLNLFVSNDTGPAHIAVAVDTPSVAIFGPADHRRWASLDQARHPIVRQPVTCSPCPHWECPIDHRCLRWVAPERVLAIAEQLLGSRQP
jgi:ADP-heptose:LPS heptosyltransferase